MEGQAMQTRRRRAAPTTAALLALLAHGPLAACGFWPTAPRPEDFDVPLRSVSGRWTGFNVFEAGSPPPSTLTLAFRLTEAADGTVTGTGTMQEAGAPRPVPITVTGSYRRPTLSLTFDGMVWAGHAVRGTITAPYAGVVGVIGVLTLAGTGTGTGTGYTTTLSVLLQETD
jgi:hypothetical protein